MLQLQQKRPLFEQLYQTSKKLVSVLATSAAVTEASKEDNVVLNRVSYIQSPLHFCKDKKNKVQVLIDSDNKVNAMTPAYALELGLRVCQTDVRVQKINGFTL